MLGPSKKYMQPGSGTRDETTGFTWRDCFTYLLVQCVRKPPCLTMTTTHARETGGCLLDRVSSRQGIHPVEKRRVKSLHGVAMSEEIPTYFLYAGVVAFIQFWESQSCRLYYSFFLSLSLIRQPPPSVLQVTSSPFLFTLCLPLPLHSAEARKQNQKQKTKTKRKQNKSIPPP